MNIPVEIKNPSMAIIDLPAILPAATVPLCPSRGGILREADSVRYPFCQHLRPVRVIIPISRVSFSLALKNATVSSILSALAESLNGKIEKVKRLAYGYRNRDHYRTAIYFHCGGLDLYLKRKPGAFQVITA